MPTAGSWSARVAEVAHATTLGGSYTAVERVNSPRLRGSNETAESSSNDSGGVKEFLYTWQSAELSFEIIADEAATGQEAIWTSFLSRTYLFWQLLPRGVSATDKRIRCQGLVTSIEEVLDKGDVGKYSVTVQLSGAMTRDNQP
jgi:hypothetical protein